MRIVVVVGRVLDPRGIFVNRRAGRVFVNREEFILQPADGCALEAALQIKDSVGAEVVVLPRGPLPDDDVLRQALAAGADRAIDLVDGGLAQADDAAMARALTAAVTRLEEVGLVLTGAATLDTGQGQLGSRLAAALGWPQAVAAWEVRLNGDRVEVVCQEEGGYGIYAADLPALVTVAPGALKLRYPHGTRLIDIYRDEAAVERWPVADLVDVELLKPLVENRGREFPPERERGVRLEGSPQEQARALADALRKRVG